MNRKTEITIVVLVVGIAVGSVAIPYAYGYVTVETLEMVNDYCIQHTDDILQGKNPIDDLITTGLIDSLGSSDFQGKTCSDVPSMLNLLKFEQDSMKTLFDSVD